ncbi:MAG: universal stress protein [Candidatus Binatia bacterium]|nr:universal stress protein [Candidatus Binatia bacterium]
MRIVIGYDGSDSARHAVDDLAYAGLPAGSVAKVITVADVWLPPEPEKNEIPLPDPVSKGRALAKQALAEAAALAEDGARLVRAKFPSWEVQWEARADSPGWGLIKAAEEWNADLLVVGSHGKGAASRLFLGSVSLKVATEAHCSVRIGRPRPQPVANELRLLLAYDGSPYAEAALAAIAQRHWPLGTTVLVVAVIEPRTMSDLASEDSPLRQWLDPRDRDARAPFERMMQSVQQRLREANITASSHLIEGDPKRELIAEQERIGADCMFVGARGLNFLQRFLLGSVSAAMAIRARCSVEITRPRN